MFIFWKKKKEMSTIVSRYRYTSTFDPPNIRAQITTKLTNKKKGKRKKHNSFKFDILIL